jgi:hypothetical protein
LAYELEILPGQGHARVCTGGSTQVQEPGQHEDGDG